MPKPTVAAGYSSAGVQIARATMLYIATKLGDLRDDCLVVGGLVPSLIVPQIDRPVGWTRHVGTMDVDLGLAVALLNQRRYHELSERLASAGFRPDVNDAGKLVNQRWRIEVNGQTATVDFLIPASEVSDRGGTLRHLEQGFAAIVTPGLELAFEDKLLVDMTGETLRGETAARELWSCGPGAFTVLKALAFAGRGENKDAYDLGYVLQHYGEGVDDVAERLQPLLGSRHAQHALEVLGRDFSQIDSVGARRAAEFFGDPENEEIRADVAGAVRALLDRCRRP